MNRIFYPRSWLLVLAIAVLGSCASIRESEKVEIAFDEGVHHRKLILTIPAGVQSESHERDTNGILIRTFHYSDGSEFFIACQDMELNQIIAIEHTPTTVSDLKLKLGEEGNGKNSDGTNWRRSIRDCFILGYNYVPSEKVPFYDESILSLKMRKA